MARAVMRAFEDRRHLIVEAGTGHRKDAGVSGARGRGGTGRARSRYCFNRHEKFARAVDGEGHSFSTKRAAEEF